MLHKINEGYVISDSGFKVKLGRHHVSYICEEGRAVTFDAEDLVGPYCLLVYFTNKIFYWRPPYSSEKLTSDELERIQSRITEVLKFLGVNYMIQ